MGVRHPVVLLGLLILPFVVAFIWWAVRRRTNLAVRFAAADMLEGLAPKVSWRKWLPPVLIVATLLAGILAGAGLTLVVKVPREQATLMIALDVSLSMKATDVKPSRLEAAKSAAIKVIESLPADMKVGVVAFAGTAQIVAPASRDKAQAVEAVKNLQLSEGTAVGEGIVTSLKGLHQAVKESELQKATAIMIMSDGETKVGIDPHLAAMQAAKQGIPVYTVAFGTPNATIEFQGERVPVAVNEQDLKDIADITHATFFKAIDQSSLEKVFTDVGSRVGLENKQVNLAGYLVAAAIILLLAALALSFVWFGRVF